MTLKSTILAAIKTVVPALQDLAIVVSYIDRSAPVYVPGSQPTYPVNSLNLSIVIVKFTTKEVDGDRIQASDWLGVVIPDTSAINPPKFNANDLIRVPSGLKLAAGDYRIVDDNKVLVGDTTVLHQLQLRKL